MPNTGSTPLSVDMSELMMAMSAKGSNVSKVLGTGWVNKRGIVTRMSRTRRGYRDRGRTRALPPRTEGKKGKLVIGRNTRKRAQAIFAL